MLACAAALAAPALGAGGLPGSVGSYLLGPKLVRAEIVVKGNHDFRLDRGTLLKRYFSGSLNLLERDGTKTSIKVASGARVTLNARPSTLRQLRAGMQIAVAHDGNLPADTVFAATARQSPRWPPAVSGLLLGNKLIRAELFVLDTVQHDYRLDHGRIKQVGGFTLLIREPDGTDVSIDVSPNARIKVNGQNGTFLELRKGMMATTMRDGDKPADQVFATGK